MNIQRFWIKGVPVAAIDIDRASDLIGARALAARGEYITVTGAHGIVESAYNPRIQRAHEAAALVLPDGMPLVWLGRALRFSEIGRVCGPDLMECIFAKPEYRKLRHFFYGGNEASVARLTTALRSRFGEFNLIGSHCPPMRPMGFVEDEIVIEKIRALMPDLVWIGLSTPKQELWMHMHMCRIGVGLGIGVGAAFDLVSETTKRAPRWIQRSGFEWLFRVAVEPRRLLKRYLFVVPRFLYFWLDTLIQLRARGIAEQASERPL